MVAASLLMLMGAAAIAIDLSAMRGDRTTDQKITDNAAAAGALAAWDGTGQDACEVALAYVAINTNEIGSLDDTGCAPPTFSASCDPAFAESHTVFSGRFTITVTYPVPDGDPLMTSGILGAPAQASADDGDPCARVGVQMSALHDGLFAQVLGFSEGTTTVHSVARVQLPPEGPPLNLLVLDRLGCQAIHIHGQGGVIVNEVVDPDTGAVFPGVAASDSDASSGCTPAVIHLQGKALLRADGPPGCSGEVTPGTGEGCGLVQVLAEGTPGCNTPACQIDGNNAELYPMPTPLAERLTRMQVDHKYNCWSDYTSPPAGTGWAVDPLDPPQQDIPGCTGDDPHIYQLIGAVGASGPSGHTTWSGSNPCQIVAGDSVTVSGSQWVDCDDFIVEGNVTINGGNVIFQGNVHVKSQGSLRINNTGSPGWAFFRGGTFTKDGQAWLFIHNTAVYLTKSSTIKIAGGSNGKLIWEAPDSGRFEDVALWSDSPITHEWAGQGELRMEGLFFTPWATADYSGISGQNQTDAQWVAHRLVAHGQGQLQIQPLFHHPVSFVAPQTSLIR